jgi:hypothetical protein
MWMHLARTVTHSTVAECMRRMDWREFLHWQALYRLQPWGDEWDMVRAVAAACLAPWSKRRINLRKFFPADHGPKPDADQLERRLNQFAARHNAKCERRGAG